MTATIRNFPVPVDDLEKFLASPEVHRISSRAWLSGKNLSPADVHALVLRGSAISLKEADTITRAIGDNAFFDAWAKERGMKDIEQPTPFILQSTIKTEIRPSYMALVSVMPRNKTVTPGALASKLDKGKGFVSANVAAGLETPKPIVDFDLILSLASILGWVDRGLIEMVCDVRGYIEPMARAIELLADSDHIVSGKPAIEQIAELVDPLMPSKVDRTLIKRWAAGKQQLDTYIATCLNTALKLPFGAFPGSVPKGMDVAQQWAAPNKVRKAVMDDFVYLQPPIRPTLDADLSFSPEEIWIKLLGSEARAAEIYAKLGGFTFDDAVQITRSIGKPPVWAGKILSPDQTRNLSELAYLERFLSYFASGPGGDVQSPGKHLLQLCFEDDYDEVNEALLLQIAFGKASISSTASQKIERWLGVPYGRILQNKSTKDRPTKSLTMSRSGLEIADTIIGENGEVVELSEGAKNLVRFVTYAIYKANISVSDDIVSDFSAFLRIKSGMPFTTNIVRSWLQESAPIAMSEMQLICAVLSCTPKQLLGDEKGQTYAFKKESVEVCKARLMNKYATLLTLKQHTKTIPFYAYTGQDNKSFIARLQLAFFASENSVSAMIKPAVIAKKLQYLCGPIIRLDDPWVHGDGFPSEDVIDRIANVIHVDAGWLAGKTPEIGFYRDAMRHDR